MLSPGRHRSYTELGTSSPVGPGDGLVAVEHAFGALVVAAVDQVAAEALQEGRVRVRPPLAGAAGLQIERVREVARGLDLRQRLHELVRGPRFVERGHPDAVLL